VDKELLKRLRDIGRYYTSEPNQSNSVKAFQKLWNEGLPIKGYHQNDILEICLGIHLTDWENWPEAKNYFQDYE